MIKILKMISKSAKHWYIPLIIGLLFVAIGIYVFTVPLSTYITLSFLFSITFIIAGLSETFFSIINHKNIDGWGWYLMGGLINLVVGILMLSHPSISMSVLPAYIAFNFLFKSLQGLGLSFDMRDSKFLNWKNIAISSLFGILFSILLLSSPILTGLSLVILTGLSFIAVGIISILISLNLKKIKDATSKINPQVLKKVEELNELLKSSK